MARLPDASAIPAATFSRRGVVAPTGGEAVGQGVSRLGAELADVGQRARQEDEALDLIKANAAHTTEMYKVQRDFEQDPNYDTYEPRFREQSDAVTNAAAENIRDPNLRETWKLKYALPHNESELNRVMTKGNALRRQDQTAEIDQALTEHMKVFADPLSTDEQRAKAKFDINSSIEAAQHVGIVNPLRAQKMRQQYGSQADEAAVRARIDRGDDLEAVTNDIAGRRPTALDTQANPETRAKPFTGQAQQPLDAARAAISTQLETGQKDPLKGLSNISRDSGGSKSYGNFGLNSGGSAQKFADEYGDLFGLTAVPGTPEFDKQWKNAAAASPVELHDAELDWYSKTITSEVPKRLTNAGVPDNIANDPRVQAYFADRSVQQGEGSIDQMAKHKSRIKAAVDGADGDPVQFLENITEADRGAYKQDFPTAIESGVYPQEGHNNRLNGRLEMSLGVGGQPAERYTGPYPDLNPRQRTTLVNVAKVAHREFTQQDLRDSEAEILRTGTAPVDAKGRTALDRAGFSLTPNELTKAKFGWLSAQANYKAVSPLPEMTPGEARDHIDSLTPSHTLGDEPYAIADKAQKYAESNWKKIQALRESDPAVAVEHTPEVAQVQQTLDLAGNRATVSQGNEMVIEARKAAQTRVGIPAYQQRILTQAEATDLLQMPANPEDPSEVDTAMQAAIQRSKDVYGKYAADALDAAISLHLKGRDNKQTARDLVSGLRGEMNKPAAAPERSWTDIIGGLFGGPAKPGTQGGSAPTKDNPAPGPASSAAPTPNQQQIDWVSADPENRQAVFDQKFGPGAFSKMMALRSVKGPQ